MAKVRIACVNGFLGAGKTSALIAAASEMMRRGLRVGIITNDQGEQLVDTAVMRTLGLPTMEISGGCFCCRFDELVRNAKHIVQHHQPDIILAEAVGSCTDLAATVYRPLQRYYPDQFEVAPLSVLVEPERLRSFSQRGRNGFTKNVEYLFEKQLQEADVIVFSKSDLVGREKRRPLLRALARKFGTPVQTISARKGVGIKQWVTQILQGKTDGSRTVNVNYKMYADAEACLGWLNATVDVQCEQLFSPSRLGESLLEKLLEVCRKEKKAIAHLKVLIATENSSDRIAATHNRARAEWAGSGRFAPVRQASLIINARVRSTPESLKARVEQALSAAAKEQKVFATIQHVESFAPPPPKPRYRLAKAAAGK